MRTYHTLILALGATVAVSGCMTPEQVAQRRMQQRHVHIAEARATCEAYGVTVADPTFAQCMLAVEQALMERDVADRQIKAQVSQALMNYSAVMLSGY